MSHDSWALCSYIGPRELDSKADGEAKADSEGLTGDKHKVFII